MAGYGYPKPQEPRKKYFTQGGGSATAYKSKNMNKEIQEQVQGIIENIECGFKIKNTPPKEQEELIDELRKQLFNLGKKFC